MTNLSPNRSQVDLETTKEPIPLEHVETSAGTEPAPVFAKHVQTWALRKVCLYADLI
jgi:hypothetical protein